jgi:hypothetical protein
VPTGDFLSVKNGWHTIGVEPRKKQKRLQRKVFHLLNQRIRESFFDVISMWHV